MDDPGNAALRPLITGADLVNDTHPLHWLTDALADLDSCELRRRRAPHAGKQGPWIEVDGRLLANYASNDYLGLAADSRLVEAVVEACRCAGWGAGASPLIAGFHDRHCHLEARLAEFEQAEAALLFSSGYAANVGVVTALASRGDAIFADALNHASLIDGCRLSRAEVHVYRHRDCNHLETLLQASRARRKLILTDTLFSMDGDIAPLEPIATLADRYGCMLVVDEAHATGVFGEHGRGICEVFDIDRDSVVRIGTLSKAMGSIGGFVVGSRTLVDWLVNRARPYIFSTASPPAMSAAGLAALNIVATEPWRRSKVLELAQRLRRQLVAYQWDIGHSESQIIPVIVGSSARALELAAALRQRGYWVPAIRPPSVPAEQARLRISLSYDHTEEMIDELAVTLLELG